MCFVLLHHDITNWIGCFAFLNRVCMCEFASFLACYCVVAAPWLASVWCSSSRGDCVYQFCSCWASIPQDVPLLSVVCLLFLTTLICLCAMSSLNSAPDQTQAIECCRSLSAQGQTFFFPPTCPWGKILDSSCISMPHIPHWYASSVKYVHIG